MLMTQLESCFMSQFNHIFIKIRDIVKFKFVNDPTAGSPTVTLLRLLLPLNDQV